MSVLYLYFINWLEFIMTSKELVQQLYEQMVHDLSVSSEQLELIVKLYQSFETPQEAEQRKQQFSNLLNQLNKLTS